MEIQGLRSRKYWLDYRQSLQGIQIPLCKFFASKACTSNKPVCATDPLMDQQSFISTTATGRGVARATAATISFTLPAGAVKYNSATKNRGDEPPKKIKHCASVFSTATPLSAAQYAARVKGKVLQSRPSAWRFLPTSAAIYFICSLLAAPGVFAQDLTRCNELTQGVFALTGKDAPLSNNQLEAATTLITEAIDCYGGAVKPPLEWLWRQRIWTLTALRRLDEALVATSTYQAEFFSIATEEKKARFFMDKYRLHLLMGNKRLAGFAWSDGANYINALPRTMHPLYWINGALLSFGEHNYDEALALCDSAMKKITHLESPSGRFAYAQVLRLRGEVGLETNDLKGAERLVRQAAQSFIDQGQYSRLSTALATLGRIEIAKGDTDDGLATLGRALELSDSLMLPRGQIESLQHLSEALNDLGRYEEAEPVAHRGLALLDSIRIEEFKTDLLIALGNAQLGMGQIAEATDTFRDAESSTDDLRIIGLARAGLLAVREARAERMWSRFAWVVVLALVGGVVAGFNLARRWPALPGGPSLRPETVPTTPIPPRGKLSPEDKILLRHIHALCFQPEQHKEILDASDPGLFERLTTENARSQQRVKPLALALGVVYAQLESAESADPYEHYRKKLLRLRKQTGATTGVYGWRLWFIERGEEWPG